MTRHPFSLLAHFRPGEVDGPILDATGHLLALAIYAPRTARGYGLARAWLREELARDGGES